MCTAGRRTPGIHAHAPVARRPVELYKGYALITLRYAPIQFFGFARARVYSKRRQIARIETKACCAARLPRRKKFLFLFLHRRAFRCFRADDCTFAFPSRDHDTTRGDLTETPSRRFLPRSFDLSLSNRYVSAKTSPQFSVEALIFHIYIIRVYTLYAQKLFKETRAIPRSSHLAASCRGKMFISSM